MPVPDSLRVELQHYMIGQKLRALRLRRSMGLTRLAERAGLSPALLSKIENGKLVPTVPTLLRIAMVFDVPLEHFFRNEHRSRIISITRRDQWERSPEHELQTPEENGCRLTSLDLGPGERKFHVYLAEFPPTRQAVARPHVHQGFEFIHMLTGFLHLSLGGEDKLLRPGDSIYFDSGLRHAYSNLGNEKCAALMVMARPEWSLSERRMEHLEGFHAFRRSPRNALDRSPSTGQPEMAQKNGSLRTKNSMPGPA